MTKPNRRYPSAVLMLIGAVWWRRCCKTSRLRGGTGLVLPRDDRYDWPPPAVEVCEKGHAGDHSDGSKIQKPTDQRVGYRRVF